MASNSITLALVRCDGDGVGAIVTVTDFETRSAISSTASEQTRVGYKKRYTQIVLFA